MNNKSFFLAESHRGKHTYVSLRAIYCSIMLLFYFLTSPIFALPQSDDEEIPPISLKPVAKRSSLIAPPKDKNTTRSPSQKPSTGQTPSITSFFSPARTISTSSSSSHSNRTITTIPKRASKSIAITTLPDSDHDDDSRNDSSDESQSEEKNSPSSKKNKEEDIPKAKRKVSISQSKETSPLKRQKTDGPQKQSGTNSSKKSSIQKEDEKEKSNARDKRPMEDASEDDYEDSNDAACDDALLTIGTDSNNEDEVRKTNRTIPPSSRPLQRQQENSSSSSSSKTKAKPNSSTSTNKTNLNVYLMQTPTKYQLFPEDLGEIAEGLKLFPWQLINETKYSLIGTENNDNETKEVFIDAQVYSKMGKNKDETIYIFQETGLRKTEWIKSIQSQTRKYKTAEETHNHLFVTNQYREPKGAVIFIKKPIKKKERFFALTFGQTGRFLLNLDHCNNSFGKHYAYNMLVSNPTYKSHSFTEIDLDEKKLKHERAKAHGKVEVLRGVTASVPKAMTVSMGRQAICSFIGAHIFLREELDFSTIGEKCQGWLEVSQKEDYHEKYSSIDDFVPLEDEVLVNDLLTSSLEDCYIDPPLELYTGHEFQTVHKYQLSSKYSWPKHYASLKYEYQEFTELSNALSQFLKRMASKQQKEVALLKLLRSLIIVPKGDTDNPLSRWRADQLISGTVSNENKTYWIEGGELFKVSKNYIRLVNKKINEYFLPLNPQYESEEDDMPSLHLLGPFKDEDKETRNGKLVLSENAYNKRMKRENPGNFVLCDCKNIRIYEDTHPHSKVEPCDLLSKEGDLIHVKRWTGSSTKITEVVSQAIHSALMMKEDGAFLKEFINKIPKIPTFAELKEKLKKYKVRIIIAFIHKDPNIKPSGLPINAKIDLYRTLVEIEKMGFKSNIIAIKDNSNEKTEVSSQSTQSSISQHLQRLAGSSSSSGSTPKNSNKSIPFSTTEDSSSDEEKSLEKYSSPEDEDGSDIIDSDS